LKDISFVGAHAPRNDSNDLAKSTVNTLLWQYPTIPASGIAQANRETLDPVQEVIDHDLQR
jgi:hypothetical protein